MSAYPGSHLPAALVVLPLMAAPICALLAHRRAAWAFAALVSAAVFALAALLLVDVLVDGTVVYRLGGWLAPWGIEYRIDTVGAFVALIVAGISAVVLVHARRGVERDVGGDRIALFYAAWLLNLTGLLGIVVTGDAFNVFVFLEVASLSSYVLVGVASDRKALLSAYRYLVVGTIGATFFLIGVGLLYGMTGTLNMTDLAARLGPIADTGTVRAAFTFIVVGLALKAAIFPLHAWLPGAYGNAPTAVSAYFAGTATKVALYVLVRFVFTVFGVELSFDAMHLGAVLTPLGLIAVLVTSVIALVQRDAKRMLAFSSVAQIGYIALGIALASVTGLAAALVHLVNHAMMKAALFMALGCIAYRTGGVAIASMAGLGRRMPFTMAAFVAAGLSLIGVPLTAGFISKWTLLQAVIEDGGWVSAAVIVIGSLIALAYVGRVAEAAYFREPEPDSIQATAREVSPAMLVPMWVLVVASFYFGIDTQLTLGVALDGAQSLLGVGP